MNTKTLQLEESEWQYQATIHSKNAHQVFGEQVKSSVEIYEEWFSA